MTNVEIRAAARGDLGRNLFGRSWLMALLLTVVYSALLWLSVVVVAVGRVITQGPLTVGYLSVLLQLSRSGGDINIGQIFNVGFTQNFGRNFLVGLLKDIYLALWSMIGVIPGAVLSVLFSLLGYVDMSEGAYLAGALGYMAISYLLAVLGAVISFIKSYSYAMAEFIAVDHPEYSANRCIEESKRMMNGHKMSLFLLDLSFIGWILLSICTLGIGFLWLYPYMMQARTIFYRNLELETASYYHQYNNDYSGNEADDGYYDYGTAPVLEAPKTGYVRCLTGEIAGAQMPMDTGSTIVIGRDPGSANLVIANDSSVSRRHCQLSYNGGSYVLTDFSKNGVSLSDGTVLQKNTPYTLAPGTSFNISKNTSFIVG